ncbi:hypothetical protein HBI18_236910 [Parastagonospora nodorum]|nr:hypothetical protein HBI18_236910 [Parastagonospora nodorum]
MSQPTPPNIAHSAEVPEDYDDASIPTPEEEYSEVYSLQEFFRTRPKRDIHSPFVWPILSEPTDPNPFIGLLPYEGRRLSWAGRTLSEVSKSMYDKISISPSDSLPCKPADKVFTAPTLDIMHVFPQYKKMDARAYTQEDNAVVSSRRVIDISRELHGLLAEPVDGRGYLSSLPKASKLKWVNQAAEFKQAEAAKEAGAAIVARELLRSHADLRSVIPIRFNQPKCHTSDQDFVAMWKSTAPQHFALYIAFKDGFTTLLPLAIDIVGGRAMPLAKSSTGTDDFWSWSDSEVGAPLQRLFHGLPMLRIVDSTMLHTIPNMRYFSADGWEGSIANSYVDEINNGVVAPRVFAETWFLTPNIQPENIYSPPLFAPTISRQGRPGRAAMAFDVEGTMRFTQPGLVINEIRKIGHKVTLKLVSIAPFALVRLDDVTIAPANAQALPLGYMHEQVDGKLTCRLAYECINERVSNSGLCEMHAARIRERSEAGKLKLSSLVRLPRGEIRFDLPQGINSLESIKHRIKLLEKFDNKDIWIVDAEGVGTTKKGLLAIPTEVGLINCANASRAHEGKIEYTGYRTRSSFITGIMHQDVCAWDELVQWEMLNRFIDKAYGKPQSGLVQARTLHEHQKIVKDDLNFIEQHALLVNWGTTKLDMDTMHRILRVEDELKGARSGPTYLTCDIVDLLSIYRYCTNLGHAMNLSSVYNTFFPFVLEDEGLGEWHSAGFDAARTRDLLLELMKEIPKLMRQMRATPAELYHRGESLKLDADDRRNPTYYELRAGYKKPDAQWYTGGPVGLRQRPIFTKENLIQGMNWTCGAFYRKRKRIAALVLSTLIHQQDLRDFNAKWDLAEVVDQASKILFSDKSDATPAFWRDCMAKGFVVKMIYWCNKHNLRLDPTTQAVMNLPRKANWKWGEGRQASIFDSYFQLQHLKTVIQVPGGSFIIRVIRIMNDLNFTSTPKDVNKDRIDLAKM